MPPTPPNPGPITAAELLELWEGAVDPGFSESLLEKGPGFGIEAYEQLFAQAERVSRAVDTTTQAMFLLPWSGQTGDPAAGEARAAVTLSFHRSKRIELPIVLGAGTVFYEEETTDWGPSPGDPGQVVLTGRRYTLLADLVVAPGEAFDPPVAAPAQAERAGYGYNNPMPGTIRRFRQPGAGFANGGATVRTAGGNDYFEPTPFPDTLVPDHEGQYVLFTAGANAGRVKRLVGVQRPAAGGAGATATLERVIVLEGSVGAGAAIAGETFQQATTLAAGQLMAVRPGAPARLVLRAGATAFDATHAVTGLASGVVFTPTMISLQPNAAPEVGTASWQVLDWADDLGFTVTNEAKPAGGRSGFLDAIGKERNRPRSAGEPDSVFRKRLSTIDDTVTPHAIARAAARALAPYGATGCLREAGQVLLPGLYYDAFTLAKDDANAYDLGCQAYSPRVQSPAFFDGELLTQRDPATGVIATGTAVLAPLAAGLGPAPIPFLFGVNPRGASVFQAGLPIVGARTGITFTPEPGSIGPGLRPQDRYRYYFSFLEMRAFFLVGVPTLPLGDFGFAYDAGAYGGYDTFPFPDFYDGYYASAAAVYISVWAAIYAVHAGGVGFDLVREDVGCF